MLLSNLSSKQERAQWPIVTLLKLFKNQSGIGKNFEFLKDPDIVKGTFLKKPNRIEVLGLVLLIELLIWHLMDRGMRQHLEKAESKIQN